MTRPKSKSKATARSTARRTAKPASRKRPAASSKPAAGPDHQACPHHRDAEEARWCYDRSDHGCNGLAAAFGARLPRWRRPQEPRAESPFRSNGQGADLSHQGWQGFACSFGPGPAGGLKRCGKNVATASTKGSIEDEIAHLRGLDLGGLRARWQSVFQRRAPAHLTRHLLFSVIAYRLQADRFGDLDQATRQVLDQTVPKETGSAMSTRLASFDQKRTELSPGSILVREWDRQSQRVSVTADGFAWNGQTYDSLSKVAFAITGTKWNGPRFFGLRDKGDRSVMEVRS